MERHGGRGYSECKFGTVICTERRSNQRNGLYGRGGFNRVNMERWERLL